MAGNGFRINTALFQLSVLDGKLLKLIQYAKKETKREHTTASDVVKGQVKSYQWSLESVLW